MQAGLTHPGAGPPPPERKTPARRSPSRRTAPLVAVAMLLALLAHRTWTNLRSCAGDLARAGVQGRARRAAPEAVPVPVAASEERRRRARERAQPRLDRADAECRQALAERLQAMDRFFADARRRGPDFAERVLGWESKWLLASERLRPGAHAAFVRRTFREALFTPEQLEACARRAAEGYLDAVRDVEGVMLVAPRQDLADLTTTLPLVTLDPHALRAHFERAASAAAERAGAGLRQDVARELTALVVGEALAQAALRLGASAGVLGAGAASSAVTWGAGLAVGLLVDRALGWAWDPRGALVRALDLRLGALRDLVVEETSEAPGLRPRLERYDRERAARRRAAVLDLIGTAGGGP